MGRFSNCRPRPNGDFGSYGSKRQAVNGHLEVFQNLWI